jgi:DtxR family transcriptional regulator, Mn-dependent transcriptional regulator
MEASRTVEDYLKAIYLAESTLTSPSDLVPMGQIASAVGVVPGTATSMVKALADSGLVRYEPYMGVRLTTAGLRLAGRVLRRHRLIELFLVKVLGMDWAEVHIEAERLEHAVSDRIIDRIDAMLGQPLVDPHGDPIPTSEGTLPQDASLDLLTAPVDAPLVVARVLDQEPGFLRYVEQRQLMPGRTVIVLAREPGSDAVRLRSEDGSETTLGTRAASQILVVPA